MNIVEKIKLPRGRPRRFPNTPEGQALKKAHRKVYQKEHYRKNREICNTRSKLYMRSRRAEERVKNGQTEAVGRFKARGEYRKKLY